MHIHIAELFSQTISDVRIDRTFDFKTIEFGPDVYSVVEPVKIEMSLTKLEEFDYLAKGKITTTITSPCSRCMEDVLSNVTAEFSKELKTNFEGEDEEELHEYLEGSVLDLEKFVLDEIYMNVPMKVLCKEDCEGLCSTCGVNLNHQSCDCENDNVDPRLAGLKDLLNEFKEV